MEYAELGGLNADADFTGIALKCLREYSHVLSLFHVEQWRADSRALTAALKASMEAFFRERK